MNIPYPHGAASEPHAHDTKALFSELSERGLRFYIESYGCQMNAHDSEKIAGMLCEMGFLPTMQKDTADLILFNTCCVREHAEKRVFGNVGALRKRKEENPGLIIGVCGCMMQQHDVAKKLLQRYPFVNFVFGTHCLHELPTIIQAVLRGERPARVEESDGNIIEGLPVQRVPGVCASINIMYGCDNYCSYCIVPYVRGRERSRLPEHILGEARSLVSEGYSELMLLGQNVNSYGKEYPGTTFDTLLRELDAIPGLRRLRFMTSHPKDLSDALITAMAELPSVCDHIHLPVQSGSDKILSAMNRKYNRADYLLLVDKLRKHNPRIELTTDIIVGFPGESKQDFADTLQLMDEVGFSAAFTFMYSPRTGTSAASMPDQILPAVKKERLYELNALQEQKTRQTNEKYIGTVGEVLVEGIDKRGEPLLHGKLSNFKTVYFPGTPDKIGAYLRVKIQKAQRNSLLGEAEQSI